MLNLNFIIILLSYATVLLSSMASPLPATIETTQGSIINGGTSLESFLRTAVVGDSLVIGHSGYTLINRTTTPGTKRQDGCNSYVYLQTNVDRTGTWWDKWKKVAGCQWCGYSAGQCHKAYGYSQTASWSYTTSFNLGGTSAAKSAINANWGLNFGYTWGESKSWSDTATCDVNPGDHASVWLRNNMGWADLAQRYVYGACEGDIAWGDWWFSHVDWTLSGGSESYETGCSSGAAAECG